MKPVTVKRLIGQLKKMPPDAICVTADDPEGNGYHIIFEDAGTADEALETILDLFPIHEQDDLEGVDGENVVIVN